MRKTAESLLQIHTHIQFCNKSRVCAVFTTKNHLGFVRVKRQSDYLRLLEKTFLSSYENMNTRSELEPSVIDY